MLNCLHQLKRLKSVDEIPEQMTEEEAAEFYGNHDLADIWDELELVEESIAVSPRLRESMIYLRLEQRYLVALNQLAQQKGMSCHALMWAWIVEKLEKESKALLR